MGSKTGRRIGPEGEPSRPRRRAELAGVPSWELECAELGAKSQKSGGSAVSQRHPTDAWDSDK